MWNARPYSRKIHFFSNFLKKGLNYYLNRLWCDAKKECAQKIRDIRNTPFRIACFSNFHDDEELGN